MNVLDDLFGVEKHYQGQHDQKNHGRRGGVIDLGSLEMAREPRPPMRPIKASDYARLKGTLTGGIPPAWRDVIVSKDPNSRLQVIGIAANGKAQYIYKKSHRVEADLDKFDREKQFLKIKPALERQLAKDYRQSEAGSLILIEKMGMRPSGADTAASYDSFGATNVQAKMVKVTPTGVVFTMVLGKSYGKTSTLRSSDPLVRKTVMHHLKGKRGNQALFGDEGGKPVHRDKVEAYLHKIAPGIKLKDLRTHIATNYAADRVKKMPKSKTPRTPRERAKVIMQISTEVSQILGNTPTVAKGSYINPLVWEDLD
jgi:DNA topoisomerase I